jgi:hypothetical protein
MTQAFEKVAKESAKAFAAFSLYLSLGEQRLLEAVATDKTEVTGADGGAIRIELEAAPKNVYGVAAPLATDPVPTVVDVERCR